MVVGQSGSTGEGMEEGQTRFDGPGSETANDEGSRIQQCEVSALPPTQPPESHTNEVDPGMVEVSIALAGIAAAIAAILPSTSRMPELLRLAIAFLAGTISLLASWSALWLLARHALHGDSLAGITEVINLLKNPRSVYWFVALALVLLIVLELLVLAGVVS